MSGKKRNQKFTYGIGNWKELCACIIEASSEISRKIKYFVEINKNILQLAAGLCQYLVKNLRPFLN